MSAIHNRPTFVAARSLIPRLIALKFRAQANATILPYRASDSSDGTFDEIAKTKNSANTAHLVGPRLTINGAMTAQIQVLLEISRVSKTTGTSRFAVTGSHVMFATLSRAVSCRRRCRDDSWKTFRKRTPFKRTYALFVGITTAAAATTGTTTTAMPLRSHGPLCYYVRVCTSVIAV